MFAQSSKRKNMEAKDQRYSKITRQYKKQFGELPPGLFNCGPAVDLYLDLMEQAIAGKRSKISLMDLGYPQGADIE